MEFLLTIGFFVLLFMVLLAGALYLFAGLLTLLGALCDMASVIITGHTLDELDL